RPSRENRGMAPFRGGEGYQGAPGRPVGEVLGISPSKVIEAAPPKDPGTRRLSMNIIDQIDQEEAARLGKDKEIPEFAPGDTVRVNVKVVEGDRSRVQAFEGVCIARHGKGLNQSFTVRKISYGEGVERVFPIYSPAVDSVKLIRRGSVRRAKLYYL